MLAERNRKQMHHRYKSWSYTFKLSTKIDFAKRCCASNLFQEAINLAVPNFSHDYQFVSMVSWDSMDVETVIGN